MLAFISRDGAESGFHLRLQHMKATPQPDIFRCLARGFVQRNQFRAALGSGRTKPRNSQ